MTTAAQQTADELGLIDLEAKMVDEMMHSSAARGFAVEGDIYRVTAGDEAVIKRTIPEGAWPVKVGKQRVIWNNTQRGLMVVSGRGPCPKSTYKPRTPKAEEALAKVQRGEPFEHVMTVGGVKKAETAAKTAKKPKAEKPAKPKREPKPKPVQLPDMMMFVPSQDAGTIEEFEALTAERKGMVYHHIPKIPSGMEEGVTRVFLAHDEGVRGHGVVFGWFPVTEVLLVDYSGSQKIAKALGQARGCKVKAVTLEEVEKMGLRDPHPNKAYVGGEYVALGKLVQAGHPRFRSYCRVDGEKLIDAPACDRPVSNVIGGVDKGIQKREKATPKSDWSEQERDALFEALDAVPNKFPTKAAAARAFAAASGRTLHGINFQIMRRAGLKAKKKT